MLSRRLAAARPLSSRLTPLNPARTTLNQIRCATLPPATTGPIDIDDPDLDPRMNGGYPNPPAQKRSLRDPYDDWWDKQERRNYGEPLHEDNDILGVFSTEPYRHFTTGFGAVLLGTFVASVFGLCGVVSMFYPDKPSVPKTYPDGLERELGGAGAWPARKTE